AIMVRLTTKADYVLGYPVPASCEVVLSPYVAHRDSQIYPDPDTFDPGRWRNFSPPPYSYFPFGIGTRYCLGKPLASFTLMSVLARMISEYDIVLSSDQYVDWKMDVTLMPSSDPMVRFIPMTVLDKKVCGGGRLNGPVAELVKRGTSAGVPNSHPAMIDTPQ